MNKCINIKSENEKKNTFKFIFILDIYLEKVECILELI